MQLIDELKEYLRIDGDDENRSLQLFLDASISYLKNAGVSLPVNFYPAEGQEDLYAQHRLTIMMLATHYYENRITVTNVKNELPYGVQMMILQLKWVNIDESSDI